MNYRFLIQEKDLVCLSPPFAWGTLHKLSEVWLCSWEYDLGFSICGRELHPRSLAAPTIGGDVEFLSSEFCAGLYLVLLVFL